MKRWFGGNGKERREREETFESLSVEEKERRG